MFFFLWVLMLLMNTDLWLLMSTGEKCTWDRQPALLLQPAQHLTAGPEPADYFSFSSSPPASMTPFPLSPLLRLLHPCFLLLLINVSYFLLLCLLQLHGHLGITKRRQGCHQLLHHLGHQRHLPVQVGRVPGRRGLEVGGGFKGGSSGVRGMVHLT